MATRERDIRKALKTRVEAYGGEIRAVSWLGRRHAPDVLCLFPAGCAGAVALWLGMSRTQGFNTYVETKRPGEKPSAAQEREHEFMRYCDCEVEVISTLEQLDAWLPPL
jgi:hypothetical protein